LIQKIIAVLAGFTGSEQSWYLVLDESAMTRDREMKKALVVVNANRRDSNARSYEEEIKMRSGGISLNEIWRIVNPFSMIKFLGYSMADII